MHHRLGIDSVNDVPEGKTDREDGLILPILRQKEGPSRPLLSGLHEPLVVQEGRVLLTLPGVVRVQIAALAALLPQDLLHPAAPRGDWVVDPHIVILAAVHGLLREGRGECRAVHRGGVLQFDEAIWILSALILSLMLRS